MYWVRHAHTVSEGVGAGSHDNLATAGSQCLGRKRPYLRLVVGTHQCSRRPSTISSVRGNFEEEKHARGTGVGPLEQGSPAQVALINYLHLVTSCCHSALASELGRLMCRRCLATGLFCFHRHRFVTRKCSTFHRRRLCTRTYTIFFQKSTLC